MSINDLSGPTGLAWTADSRVGLRVAVIFNMTLLFIMHRSSQGEKIKIWPILGTPKIFYVLPSINESDAGRAPNNMTASTLNHLAHAKQLELLCVFKSKLKCQTAESLVEWNFMFAGPSTVPH